MRRLINVLTSNQSQSVYVFSRVVFFSLRPWYSRKSRWKSEKGRYLSLSRVAQQEGTHDTGGDADTAEDGDAHEALLGDLVVDELAQVGGLKVGGLLLEEEVVVAAGLSVVAELVAAEGEVVEAFAAALGGEAEDLGEEADAELLVVAVGGLDEALVGYVNRVDRWGRGEGGGGIPRRS